MLQCVAVSCSVLQCVAVCCSVLQRVAMCCSFCSMCRSRLQCIAVCVDGDNNDATEHTDIQILKSQLAIKLTVYNDYTADFRKK